MKNLRLAFVTLILVIEVCECCNMTDTAVEGTITWQGYNIGRKGCTYTIIGCPRTQIIEFTVKRVGVSSFGNLQFGKEQQYSGTRPEEGTILKYEFVNNFTIFFKGRWGLFDVVIDYRILPGCPCNRYGKNCTEDCSVGCTEDACDSTNGHCQCRPGWRGELCNLTCQAGRYGADCGNTCSSGCSDDCDRQDGTCTCNRGKTGPKCKKECPDGTYGYYCTNRCSQGCADDTCNKIEGGCACKPGYMGRTCTQKCSSSRYGINCGRHCSSGCRHNTCDPTSGSCACLPGWTGEKCNIRCKIGTFGVNCSGTCSEGCSGECDRDHGLCSCEPGWTGTLCQLGCSFNTYGVNCVQTCSVGCEPSTCDPRTGECHCLPGWKGGGCQEECGNRTYGTYCNNTCSIGCVGSTCDSENGTCSCNLGYSGVTCDSEESNIGLVVGTSTGCGVAVLLIVIGLIALIKWRKQKMTKTSPSSKRATCHDIELQTAQSTHVQSADREGNIYVNYDSTDDPVYQNSLSVLKTSNLKKKSVHVNIPSSKQATNYLNPSVVADDDSDGNIYEVPECQEPIKFRHLPVTDKVSTEDIYVNQTTNKKSY